MALPSPVCFDILNFHELDWYVASTRISTILAQKGFCFVQGPLEQAEKDLARDEASALKAAGKLARTPAEAVDAFYGEVPSAWTYEVHSSAEANVVLSDKETGLRTLDACLDQIGYSIVAGSESHLKRAVRGRSRGILHYSREQQDDEAPSLVDPEEAAHYASHCSTRKVVILYYLGPSSAVASFAPRDDPSRVYEVRMKEDTVIAYVNDACTLVIQELGPGLIYEVDLTFESKLSQQEAPKDLLGIPSTLHHWFEERLKKIRSDSEDVSLTYPFSYVKQAHLAYLQDQPVKIVHFCCELPSMARQDGVITPLEGRILGGGDTALPIIPPPPAGTSTRTGLNSMQYFGAKWNLQDYYDEDGDVDNFKTYAKHLNVLYRSYDMVHDFDYERFGLTSEENASLDHRCRLLCEAHVLALRQVKEDDKAPGKPWGIFAGLSGQQQDFHPYMTGETKITRHTWASSSISALVSRCSYGLNFSGPAVAIDTGDSSGLIASDAAVKALRDGSCQSAFASSASWISNPFELITLCAAGFISKCGRAKVFDESSDGYTKGEGVVTLLLRKSKDESKDVREVRGARALLLGSGVNNKGQSSSLGSPSGPAIRDVLHRASRDAHSAVFLMDAVEASASGDQLSDQVELMVLQKKLEHQDRSAQAVVVCSSKAGFGNLGAPSGLVGVVRSVFLLERGLHAPQIHLRELMDVQLDEDSRERWLFLTEVVEARGYAQLLGVSSFGRTGSNCHQVLIGERPEQSRKLAPSRTLRWWPGAKPNDKKEAIPVLRGYFLVGTMTAWTDGLRMEEESEGVYGYTLTMGDNNWEKFQVWLDEDPDKVLHPMNADDGREAAVIGPESNVHKGLSWKITGKPQQVRLINEEQFQSLKAPEEESMDVLVAFGGGYVPPEVEDPTDISQMPVANTNAGLEGNPGDKYRIRLHVQGRYKRLEWFKARGADAVAPLSRRRFQHKFSIIGDHSYWTWNDMQESATEKGTYVAKVQILKSASSFQIFRDRDFEQGFYPASKGADILGPDELGQGQNWILQGKAGDIFQVTFRRHVRRDQDTRNISWEKVGFEELDFEEMAKSHKYYLVGSWNQFRESKEMFRDPDETERCVLKQEVTVGKTGAEKFQILLNSNWLAAVHPDRDEATGEDRLQGPDDGGSGKYWAIGVTEQLDPGDHVMVYLEITGGLPSKVWWEKFDSPDAHQEYLAAGSQRVFERHMRLMGLIPWQSQEKPARLVNPPEWYGGGRDREDLELKNVFVLTEEMLNPNFGKEEEEEPFKLSDK